ncbi:MAG TPA: hypothetical protein VJ023_14565 [Pyrinomonadaceae bacterium]|nr:hypothetical protein [Pyrinomonadaceae bacterium]
MKKKLFLAAALSVSVVVAATKVSTWFVSAERDANIEFIIGILRADGTLLPFAQYGNGGWFNPWPKPADTQNVYADNRELIPHSLGDLREPWFKQCGKIPNTWYLWSTPETLMVLRASKLVQVENHSQTNWALLTDFPKQISEGHHKNLGVVLNAKHKIEPWIQIKPESSENKEIWSFVKQLFDEAETAQLDRIRAEHPQGFASSTHRALFLTRDDRRKISTSLTHLYRSNSANNGEYLFYFEAEKEYQTPTAPGRQDCNDISLFQGWISTQGKGGLGLFDSRVFFTNCDRKGPSFTTPLGIMNVGNRSFLFVTEHGWEDESYIILELDRSGLHRVLETFGG